MHKTNSLLRTLLRSAWSLRVPALVTLAVIAANSMAYAQLNGTYTIGGASPSYATIDAALTALSGGGVSGPVTFLIRSGTYTPPAAGYVLNTYAGMSTTNTVTFRPDAGATVMITGTTNASTAIFILDGAKFYVFDGSNVVGGTTRNMTIRQTQTTANPAIWMKNDADNNIVKNCILQADGGSQSRTSSTTGIGIVFIGTTTAATGNDSNLVVNNLVGDPAGTYRCNIGIGIYGTSAKPNNGNRIIGNDVVNFGKSTTATGINIYAEQAGTVVDGNDVHMTVPSPVATIYGLYTDYSPGYPINSVFNGNRVYKLTSTTGNWTIYGMYHWVSTAAANSTITNNMISVGENGDHTVYGIYYQSSTGATKFYHNTIYVGGAASGTRNSYVLYKSAANSIDSKNNILYSERSGGTGSHYGLYISSITTWASNYNVINVQPGATSYIAYYSGARVTMTDYRTASSQDANSFPANPRLIDPMNGDLHVSAVLATPVEGTGTPLAGILRDFDNQTRSATTPDIGADEGTFIPSPSRDIQAEAMITPVTGGIVSSGIPFSPVARILNNGTLTQTSVSVRYVIRDAANTIVYNDVQTVASIGPFASVDVTFNQTGNVSGSTIVGNGNHTVQVTTTLAGDQNTSNDVLNGTFIGKGPLNGIYTINKSGSGPRNFPSFTTAIDELKSVGMLGPVTFEVASGTYDAATETFPFVLTPVTGISAVNTVTFKPALGATVTVTGQTPSGSALFVIEGGRYFIFDGSNTPGGTTRNMTIRQTETTFSPAIWLRNDADNNVIKNCILQADGGSQTRTSSTTGSGIVFIGTVTAAQVTGNDSNLVENNVLGDPLGALRCNIGISQYGTLNKPNRGNRIIGNDVVNFGKSSTATGINIYGDAAGTVVEKNEVHMTAPTSVATVYGIYTDYSPGYPINSVFNANRVYNIGPSVAGTIYGFYHWVSLATSTNTITNNMISVGEDGDQTVYGIYFLSSTGTVHFHNNSIHISGNNTGTRLSYAVYKSGAVGINSINNIFSSSRAGTGTHYGVYLSSTTGWLSRNNMFGIQPAGNVNVGYHGGARSTLAAFQSASGQEGNSVVGVVPFMNPVNGNLHINPMPVFQGEGTGATGLNGLPTVDFDNEAREMAAPDMGADEGNFNGGGLRVLTPNGGEKYSVDYELDVHFTANRPLPVRLEFSADGGASWTPSGTANAVAGENIVTIVTPNAITQQALVRVISQKNQYEADTSDAVFELVLPIFTIQYPNGGEKLVPTDTVQLQFHALYTPPQIRLQLDLSTNNGVSWAPIDTNVYASGSSEDNSYTWIVPDIQTDQALIRVKVANGNIRDISDAPFTILPKPYVAFFAPAANADLYAGETSTLRWDSRTTNNIKLNYSTDAGLTWNDVVDAGIPVAAWIGEYDWVVPGTPSMNAQLKITNVERPRFFDVVNVKIRATGLQLLAPNGGEKYEQAQPVQVTWTSTDATRLRIDYSSDNGNTWKVMASSVDPALGSFIIHPPAVPTVAARVRIVDAARSNVWDISDGPFEIMEGKHIVVHTPASNDELTRNTMTTITWSAPRIERVNISYSMDGGGSWQMIATNVLAEQGSMIWTTPSQTSNQVKIRVQEAGGPTIGESGIFRIVEQSTASVRVLYPEGGEHFTVGETIAVRWTASGETQPFTVKYTMDNGLNPQWHTIGTVASDKRELSWTITSEPGTNYYVSVTSGTLNDVSGRFTVERPLEPGITVLYPNGNENFAVDSLVQVRWFAKDVAGTAAIMLSTDGGSNWSPIGSTDVNNGGNNSGGTFSWRVPNQLTTQAKIKVQLGTTAEDASDENFTISAPTVPQIVIGSPNGGEEWRMKSKQTIAWTSPEGVQNVDIAYSVDNGTNYTDIRLGFPVTLGSNTYEWTVPESSTEYINTVLVRVRNSANPTLQADISNAPFSILFAIAGVENGVAGARSLRILGNYPNPFAGRTEIRWEQARKGAVELRVYQQNGTLVSHQDLGSREAGEQRYELRVEGLASGAYIYEVRVAGEAERSVMMVVR